MNFAINYSPQAAELLAGGRIEIDYFKTPPWPEMIAKAERQRPVAVHFGFHAGTGQLDQTDWGEIEDILKSTATIYVNAHLAADARDGVPFDCDNPSPDEVEQIIADTHADVAALVDRFGAERVILENAPYRVGQGHVNRVSVLPEVICDVIERHGCGLLLDISHARISADTLGMDPKDYIQALPVARLRELHFTGLHDLGGGFLMDHLPVLEDDWPWLDWVLEGIEKRNWGKAHMLAYEYGGEGNDFFEAHSDPAVITRDAPRMYARCHGMEPGSPQVRPDQKKRLLSWVLLSLSFGAAIALLIYIARNREAAKDFIQNLGFAGPLASILLYGTLAFSPIPADPLTLIVGGVFGPVGGGLVAWTGMTFAAMVEYFVGTRIGDAADFEQRRENLPFGLDELPVDSVAFLLGGRLLTSVGSKAVSYLSGIYRVSLWRYLWTTMLSTLFGALVFALGGAGLLKIF